MVEHVFVLAHNSVN